MGISEPVDADIVEPKKVSAWIISGLAFTRDDKRYLGCFMGEPGGCSCCASGGILEFVPKASYAWPTSFPPVEGRITLMGRLKMFEVGPPE